MKKLSAKKLITTYSVLAVILIAALLLSLRFGSQYIEWGEFFNALIGRGETTTNIILFRLRLPRIIGGVVAGAALALSGVLLQSVTGNNMAAPNLIGVNAGAGFAVIVTLFFFPVAVYALPFSAFVGAFIATVTIIAIAGRAGMTKSNVVLAGIAFSALLNAGISLLSLLDSDVLVSYNAFSIGSLAGTDPEELYVPSAITLLCIIFSMLLSHNMNVLSLGDGIATSLGINVKRTRIFAMLIASASAAAAVSYAGLLGFVGLIVPHVSKKLVGENIRHVIPVSALCGGILLVLADFTGRMIFSPSEVPVGIITAVIGAPFFMALLINGRRKEYDRI